MRDVHKSFGRGIRTTPVLHGIDLEITAGSSLGIVGESGAGKTTILSLLMALSSPTSGTIEFNGAPLRRGRVGRMSEFRRAVQLVFQDPRSSLNPRMSVGRIIREPLESLDIPGDHRARVADLLESVGLEPGMESRFPGEFSGGQRQRIAIARALAPRPEVLVADEPVSALDVSVRAQIVELLARLKEQFGMTLVMVSHDIAIVGQLCEEMVILRDGRIEETGPTPRVLTAPRAAYTRRLLEAVPRLPRGATRSRCAPSSLTVEHLVGEPLAIEPLTIEPVAIEPPHHQAPHHQAAHHRASSQSTSAKWWVRGPIATSSQSSVGRTGPAGASSAKWWVREPIATTSQSSVGRGSGPRAGGRGREPGAARPLPGARRAGWIGRPLACLAGRWRRRARTQRAGWAGLDQADSTSSFSNARAPSARRTSRAWR